jgi:hypothetical protein
MVVAYFKVLLEGLSETTKDVTRDSWYPGRDSKWTTSQYELEGLPLDPYSLMH